MNLSGIQSNVSVNLDDLGLTYFTSNDIQNSVQDAYDDIAVQSQCIIKKVTLSFQAKLSYYDFRALGVSDYVATVAIFNNATNLWLRDDLSIRDFDRIRRDWETWVMVPIYWCPVNFQYISIIPKYTIVPTIGTFDLYYWAAAPKLANPTDTPLVAGDMQVLFENYATGDLLEQAEEYVKAQSHFEQYYKRLAEYGDRVKRINKSDLLLRV